MGGPQCIVGWWRTQRWEGCNALWGGGGPRGGRATMHCGMLEDPGVGGLQCTVGCWRAQVGGLQCIVGCWRTQGWTGCNTLWDAGGPGVGGPQCIVGCWRTQRWEGCNALWDAGGPRGGRAAMRCGMLEDPGVGGLQCTVGWWRTWGGRTAMHCGMLEGPGWEDRTALWGGGGPGVGGPHCIVGWWRTPVHHGMLEEPDGGLVPLRDFRGP